MSDNEEHSNGLKETKHYRLNPQLVESNFPTVHVDKAMVAINRQSDTATITLLAEHIIPKVEPTGDWGIDNVRWDIVGEIKIPIPALNALAIYYIQEMSNGLNIMPIIAEHLKKHPLPPPQESRGFSYGPSAIRQTPK